MVFLCDFSTLIYLSCIMRFRFYSVFLLSIGLFPLHSYAAEPLLSVSAVSAATSAADETVYIEAQQIVGKKDEQMEAHGNVELQQGSQRVLADHLFYAPSTGDLSADGSVRVEQPSGTVSGPDLKMNMDSSVGEMNKPVFQLNQNNARGSAATLRRTGKLFYEFDNATYTTCPAGNDDWLVKMSRLELDKEAQLGTAHNAWVEFMGVPFLYTPWMNFPLDGRRKTGLLGPIYGRTSSGGTELTVPLYLNIAPNYDATIAPRVMEYRGTMLNDEFRYMGASYSGVMHYDVLQNDAISNTTRTHTSLKHTESLGGGVGLALNLNRVSDYAYFRDFSGSMGEVMQTQLLNEGALTYGGGWWSTSVRAQTYQTLQDPLAPVAVPFFRLPQITLSAQKKMDDVQLNIVNEYVNFRNDIQPQLNSQRLVLYPSVTYSLLSDPGYYLKPKLGIHSTRYVMGSDYVGNYSDTSRTLPIFSLDSGMTFERDLKLGASEYLQTLEPRVFYVKVPYQNQDFLPVYDTSQAAFSFAQMFNENRFFGNDRVGDANMATVALTSRLIDNTGGVERLRVTLGERFSYQPPLVNLGAADTNSRSDILLSVGGRVTNALTLDSLVQYSPIIAQTLSYNASARFKPETGKVLNLGYRYTFVDGDPMHDIRQGDFSTQWPLFWHWNAVSRVTFSFTEGRILEEMAGLEYNQSCWMLRLVAQKFPLPNQHTSTGIFIQLELNDFIALGRDPLETLRLGIPGYSKLNAKPTSQPAQGLH